MAIISRRNLLALAAMAPAASLVTFKVASGAETADVNMQIGWLGGNGILGETIGLKKGFFADEGLDLQITPGGPNVDGIAAVASGAANFGQYNSTTSIMLARSEGIPIKAFAAGFQKHPFAFVSKKEKPVRTPRDLIGKRIGIQATSLIILKALMKLNDIKESDVEIVTVGPEVAPFITGQVDVFSLWLTTVSALKTIGDDRVEMLLWDTGVRIYANLYYASDKVLAENQEMLVKFTRACARGWGYAREHPEEAVDALVEAYPNLDRANELEASKVVLGFSFNETTKAQGWGFMDPDVWAKQIATWDSIGELKGSVPKVEDVMTLDILNATTDIRKQVG